MIHLIWENPSAPQGHTAALLVLPFIYSSVLWFHSLSSGFSPQAFILKASVLSHGLNRAKIATQVATPIATRKHILLTSHLKITSCPPTQLVMLQETTSCLSHTFAEGRISNVSGTRAILETGIPEFLIPYSRSPVSPDARIP